MVISKTRDSIGFYELTSNTLNIFLAASLIAYMRACLCSGKRVCVYVCVCAFYIFEQKLVDVNNSNNKIELITRNNFEHILHNSHL